VVHGSKELQLVDPVELTTVILAQEVETLLVHELTRDFKSDLITPSINERHAQVIKEDGHVLATEGHVDTGLFTLDFRFDGLLEIQGSRGR
jgi:hypothetical protein